MRVRSIPYFLIPAFWIFLFGAALVFGATPGAKVLQYATDTKDRGQGWALTAETLRFNPTVRSGGQWVTRFNKQTFERIAGQKAENNFKMIRIQPSPTEMGAVYLILENGAGGKGRRWTFLGRDQGTRWALFGQKNVARAVSSPEPPAVAPQPETKPAAAAPEAVDLSSLDAAPTPIAATTAAPSAAGTSVSKTRRRGTPEFKFMFDFWMHNRPGISPLTFASQHTLALVDIFPTAKSRFSFELAGTPRFFEFGYQFSPQWSFRLGRIWVPFDTLGPTSPHNYFGGYVNVSMFRQPAGTAFLPDLWTDLGVAVKYQIMESRSLSVDGELYVVNGFGSGGTDPAGQIGTDVYPNFNAAPTTDNNVDKGIGLRGHAQIGAMLDVGLSGYMGRFSDQASEAKSVYMLGLDSQLRFTFGLELKAGYSFMLVELAAPATQATYRRGGTYFQATQRLAKTWKAFARGGTAQNDSRVVSVDDIFNVGGGFIWSIGFMQVSFAYQKDLAAVAGKTGTELGYLHALILL